MVPETDTLTNMLETFLEAFKLGRVAVGGDAWNLLSILATLEILLASLWWSLRREEFTANFLKKVILIGFFIFVVSNWDSLISTVVEGFIHTGATAGSAAGGTVVSLRNPSAIVDAGFKAVFPIFDHIRNYASFSGFFGNVPDVILTLIASFVILGAYFVLAIQVFVTRLEFGLIATLGLILVPFGVFKQTAFLAEKVFGAVISFGVKLMVLSFIISVTFPVLAQYQVPPDPSWPQLFSMMVIALAVMSLAWHAPGVAAGLLAATPSLTAGTAAVTAASVNAASGGTFARLSQGAKGGAEQSPLVKESLASTARGGAVAAGAVHGAKNAPGSTALNLAGRAARAGKERVASPLRDAGEALKESYKKGREFRPPTAPGTSAIDTQNSKNMTVINGGR